MSSDHRDIIIVGHLGLHPDHLIPRRAYLKTEIPIAGCAPPGRNVPVRYRPRHACHIILVPLGVSWAFMALVANWRAIKRDDEDSLRLAQRWSKYMAITFAVGAMTGTVLTFEFGLLWPKFMGTWGLAFGIPFAVEGPFFFIEAIFIALCGLGSLVLLLRRAPRGGRLLAAGAVASIIWTWGVAQWPYILPTSLKVSAAAAPSATLATLLVVFGVAAVVVLPSLAFLYVLDPRSLLPAEPSE